MRRYDNFCKSCSPRILILSNVPSLRSAISLFRCLCLSLPPIRYYFCVFPSPIFLSVQTSHSFKTSLSLPSFSGTTLSLFHQITPSMLTSFSFLSFLNVLNPLPRSCALSGFSKSPLTVSLFFFQNFQVSLLLSNFHIF